VVAGAARAALGTPASIVAPSSAATAIERVARTGLAIGREKADMALSFQDFGGAWKYHRLSAMNRIQEQVKLEHKLGRTDRQPSETTHGGD
jgi:hypothetical protein